MTKRPKLGAALRAAAQGVEPEDAAAKVAAAPKPAASPAMAAATFYKAPSREGKRQVTLWFDPTVVKQLKQLALDEDTTVQALGAEALNDLFAKRGKPRIAS